MATNWTDSVARARAGNAEAFADVVRHFQPMAVGYALSLLGDVGQAEDAAQEAFLAAYCHLAQLRDPQAFPAWFRQIVRTHSHRLMRRRQLRTVPLEGARRELLEMIPATGPTPSEAAQRREEGELVHQAIRELPEKEREAVVLFHIAEHPQAEVAKFLGVPISTVKNRLFSARKKLRERMLTMLEANLRESRPGEDFTQRVQTLVRHSWSVAPEATADRAAIDVRPVVESTIACLRTALPSNVRLSLDVSPGSGAVRANPFQIHQVVAHLCLNGAQAMEPDGGPLDVLIESVQADAWQAQLPHSEEGDDYIHLMVRDMGCGLDSVVAERIFEPFFTTKPEGRGYAAGLATVWAIALALGGDVTWAVRPRTGTEFHVYLPRAPEGEGVGDSAALKAFESALHATAEVQGRLRASLTREKMPPADALHEMLMYLLMHCYDAAQENGGDVAIDLSEIPAGAPATESREEWPSGNAALCLKVRSTGLLKGPSDHAVDRLKTRSASPGPLLPSLGPNRTPEDDVLWREGGPIAFLIGANTLIEQLGGTLWATSETDRGTLFEVHLPIGKRA